MGPCNSKDPEKRPSPYKSKENIHHKKNSVRSNDESQKELNFEVTISNIKATNITQVKADAGWLFYKLS